MNANDQFTGAPFLLSCSLYSRRLYSKVAFLETDIKKTGSLVLFLVNRFVDLGFIVDIGFTFFLPYMNAQGNPVKVGRMLRVHTHPPEHPPTPQGFSSSSRRRRRFALTGRLCVFSSLSQPAVDATPFLECVPGYSMIKQSRM